MVETIITANILGDVKDIITAIQKTPIPLILILAGVLFIFLSFTNIITAGKIQIRANEQKRARVFGVIFLALGLAMNFLKPTDNTFVKKKFVVINANDMWRDTGVTLNKGQELTIIATGKWTNGGDLPQYVGPGG